MSLTKLLLFVLLVGLCVYAGFRFIPQLIQVPQKTNPAATPVNNPDSLTPSKISYTSGTYTNNGANYINGEIKSLKLDTREISIVSNGVLKNIAITKSVRLAKGNPQDSPQEITFEDLKDMNIQTYNTAWIKLDSKDNAVQILFLEGVN